MGRIFEEKALTVGVAGRTFIEECGERPLRLTVRLVGLWIVSRLLELCEEALLCEVPCRGRLRMEETDEDVDLRPRKPVELRL